MLWVDKSLEAAN